MEDGRLAIDNNAAERLMKPVAFGRKNWLFVGSGEAGSRAAVLMSLVASCKLNRWSLEPTYAIVLKSWLGDPPATL